MTAVNLNPAAQAPLLQSAGTLPERPKVVAAPHAEVPQAAPAGQAKVEEASRPTREAVDLAAHRIEQFVQSVGRSMSFSVDASSGHSILRVVDPNSGEVIRQLPAEETIRVAKAVEYMQSMLVNQRA
jgi:flagellar protein FlaG